MSIDLTMANFLLASSYYMSLFQYPTKTPLNSSIYSWPGRVIFFLVSASSIELYVCGSYHGQLSSSLVILDVTVPVPHQNTTSKFHLCLSWQGYFLISQCLVYSTLCLWFSPWTTFLQPHHTWCCCSSTPLKHHLIVPSTADLAG